MVLQYQYGVPSTEYKHKHSSGSTELFQRVVAQLPISWIIDVFVNSYTDTSLSAAIDLFNDTNWY